MLRPAPRARPPIAGTLSSLPGAAGAALAADTVRYGPGIPTENELKLLGRVDGRRILDLSCGAGANAVTLAKAGARVIAVDDVADNLADTRERAAREKVRVEAHHGPLAELAFVRADTIDAALSAYGLATVDDLGRVFRQVHRVLRIESEATEIPSDFPISSAKRNIDYDWTTISGERYLLPSLSEVRLTFRQSKDIYETRNLIRFRDYQKYGTEVQILEVDDEPIEEENP